MSAHHSDRSRFLLGNMASHSSRPLRWALPQYQVVLAHDPVNELPFIVRAVMELTRFCKDEATWKMWEAHHRGRAVLLRTYRERAELFVELFAEKGITVMLEPV